MFQAQRHQIIIEHLNQLGTVHVKDLAKELNISEATIRRDLLHIERLGLCQRVHGGAIKDYRRETKAIERELNVVERKRFNAEEKDKVCRAAAELVKDGDCVFIDGGTTTETLIDYLSHRQITIVTYSELILHRINGSPKAEVIMLGGKYHAKYAMTTGTITYNTMSQFNFDLAFIGCNGVNLKENIVYSAEMETRSIKTLALRNSLRNYLLLDHTKLEVKGFTKFTEFENFTKIFCNYHEEVDAEVPENWNWVY